MPKVKEWQSQDSDLAPSGLKSVCCVNGECRSQHPMPALAQPRRWEIKSQRGKATSYPRPQSPAEPMRYSSGERFGQARPCEPRVREEGRGGGGGGGRRCQP